MWSAIKNDLFEFVNTVSVDTSKVVTKVLGEDEAGDKEEISAMDKRMMDIRRSFITYSTPIEDKSRKSFESWRRGFSLTTKATEIAQVLDQEPDVSRFYADLVPTNISADDFWARYFFRITLLQKGGAVTLDEDDEEDIGWEDDEEADDAVQEEVYDQSATQTTDLKSSNTSQQSCEVKVTIVTDTDIIAELRSENTALKTDIGAMTTRISQLEVQLSEKNTELQVAQKQITELQASLAQANTPQGTEISSKTAASENKLSVQSPIISSVMPSVLTPESSTTVTPEPKKKTKASSGDKSKGLKSKTIVPKPAADVASSAAPDISAGKPLQTQNPVVVDEASGPRLAAVDSAASVAQSATAPVNLSLEDDEEDGWA